MRLLPARWHSASSSHRFRSTRFHVHRPAAVTSPTSTAAIANRDRWNRLARCIIARWGSVQCRRSVSVRMPSHSRASAGAGSRAWRSRAARSASRSSARPATRLPLLAGQPVAQGVDQVIVCELVVLPARQGRLTLARGTFRVGGRDQAKLRVEDVDQVIEVPGAVRITRSFEQLLARSHLPLDVGAASREAELSAPPGRLSGGGDAREARSRR